eukprot:GGOE01061893.1.p1 GENE.GGOE01061893.1~~GGOE01061893.1.p1  ORF type:complete len:417 (+),score=123.58 GGOE01061893.1:96-1346(+)
MTDLLAYLQVTVPQEPSRGRPPSSGPSPSSFTYFHPREPAPPPLRRVTTPARSTTLSPQGTSPALSRRVKVDDAEYIVMDSPIPCNMAINVQLAEERRERQRRQREAEAAAVAEHEAAERQWQQHSLQQTHAAKEVAQRQLRDFHQRWAEAVEQAKAEEAKQRQQVRETQDRILQEDREAGELQKAAQRQLAQRLAAHQKQTAALDTERKAQGKAEQRAAVLTSLPLQTWDIPPDVLHAHHQQLQESLRHQMEERAQRIAQRQAADAAVDARTVEQCVQMEAACAAQEAGRRQAQQEQLCRYYEAEQQAKAEQLQEEQNRKYAAAEARVAAEAEAQIQQRHIVEEARRRAQLQGANRRRHVARVQEEKAERRRQEAEMERRISEAAKVRPQITLLRCPVTGLVLPPSCFNVVAKDR